MLNCKKCGQDKPLAEMVKKSSVKGGYLRMCRTCRSDLRYENGEYLKEVVRRHAKDAGQKVPLVDVDDLLELQTTHKTCPYCAVELTQENRTVDHVYAKTSIYGKNIPQNLVYCCRQCNSSKGALTVVEYYDRSDKFTYELFKTFIQTVIAPKMMGVEVLDDDIPAFIEGLRAESKLIRQLESEAIECEKVSAY